MQLEKNQFGSTFDFIPTKRVIESFGEQYNIIIFLLLSVVHRGIIIIILSSYFKSDILVVSEQRKYYIARPEQLQAWLVCIIIKLYYVILYHSRTNFEKAFIAYKICNVHNNITKYSDYIIILYSMSNFLYFIFK